METSTARPQEAVERRGKGVRRAGRRMMAFVRGAARPVGQAMMVFLFTFVRWFGIPSPFAAALLLARTEKPTPLMLAGAGVSLAVRALWGLELDVWQYVGIAGLWLALRRCRPRPGIETAALGGLAMMPRVFAALAGQAPLDIMLSLAAVPLGMLGAAFFRSAMDGMASTGAPTCTRERACVAALGLLLVGGTGYFWVGSLNLGQLTAVWVTVAYAAANGPVYGVAAGLLCGLSLALGGHDVRMAATLSVMGTAVRASGGRAAALAVSACRCGGMGGWLLPDAAEWTDGSLLGCAGRRGGLCAASRMDAGTGTRAGPGTGAGREKHGNGVCVPAHRAYARRAGAAGQSLARPRKPGDHQRRGTGRIALRPVRQPRALLGGRGACGPNACLRT